MDFAGCRITKAFSPWNILIVSSLQYSTQRMIISYQKSLIKMLNTIPIPLSSNSLHRSDFSTGQDLREDLAVRLAEQAATHKAACLCCWHLLPACTHTAWWVSDNHYLSVKLSVWNGAQLSHFVIWKQMIHWQINRKSNKPNLSCTVSIQYTSGRNGSTTRHTDFY